MSTCIVSDRKPIVATSMTLSAAQRQRIEVIAVLAILSTERTPVLDFTLDTVEPCRPIELRSVAPPAYGPAKRGKKGKVKRW